MNEQYFAFYYKRATLWVEVIFSNDSICYVHNIYIINKTCKTIQCLKFICFVFLYWTEFNKLYVRKWNNKCCMPRNKMVASDLRRKPIYAFAAYNVSIVTCIVMSIQHKQHSDSE